MATRRTQRPITIRSDKAATLLAAHTRDGRSQAEVIEEALERLPRVERQLDLDARVANLLSEMARLRGEGIPTIAEFDAREYDEDGNPR